MLFKYSCFYIDNVIDKRHTASPIELAIWLSLHDNWGCQQIEKLEWTENLLFLKQRNQSVFCLSS